MNRQFTVNIINSEWFVRIIAVFLTLLVLYVGVQMWKLVVPSQTIHEFNQQIQDCVQENQVSEAICIEYSRVYRR